jgi:hypothetical protein
VWPTHTIGVQQLVVASLVAASFAAFESSKAAGVLLLPGTGCWLLAGTGCRPDAC